MKKMMILVVAAVAMIACHKSAPVDVKAEAEKMSARVDSLMQAAETEEEAETIISEYLDDMLTLYIENADASYADTLLGEMYFMLSAEQREQAFAATSSDRLEEGIVGGLYTTFQAEKNTSVGCPYTDIVAYTRQGEEVAVSQFVGQTEYVLIDFWASWCGPCRRLIPGLKNVYAAHSDKLQIISISCDRDSTAWVETADKLEIPWVSLLVNRDEEVTPLDVYGVMAIPTTILIDKDGMIVGRNIDEEELEAMLQ